MMLRLGLVLALACLSGCSQTNISEYIKALAGDPATVCFSGIYAGASIKIGRTNITNGDVQCNDNGMIIKSVAPQLNVPAQVTIQQPVTVTQPPK